MPITRTIRCVAFDFDGTLVDSNPIKENGFYVVAQRRGIDAAVVDRALAEQLGGNRFQISKAIAARLAAEHAVEELARALADEYTEHCLEAVGSCPEVPGARATLEVLAGRLPVYVNSATPHVALGPVLARRGLTQFLAGVLGGPVAKTENLRTIAAAERLEPSAMLFIGDSDDDLEAAAAFGCGFIGITLRGHSRFRQPVAATRDDLRDLAVSLDLGRT